jgi:hypothetical protein
MGLHREVPHPRRRAARRRDDSPVAEIEFQCVRDGAIVGRSVRVPAGTGPAAEVAS